MTMTPLPQGAAPAAASYGVPATAPTGLPVPPEAAAGFLALFLAAMPAAGGAPLSGAPVPGEGDAVTGEEADGQRGSEKDAAAALLLADAGLLGALGLAPVTTGPVMAGQGTAADAAATTTATTTGTSVPDGAGQARVAAAVADAAMALAAAAQPGGGTPGDAAAGVGTEPGTAVLTGTGDAATGANGEAAGPDLGSLTAVASAAPSAETAAPAPGSSASGQSVAGLTATTAASAPRTDLPSGPQAPAPAVAAQVFPEVSRLVSRGDGTHRLTMTLSPEALGDVRVVLTVRNGEVTVTFAAGSEAQQALMESAPELRRLLELTGATESRIQLRDAAGATTQTNTGQTTGQPGAEQQGAGQESPDARRDPQDHHARTREGQIATDGTHRGQGASRPPHDPVTDSRPAGVDVTV